MPRTAIIAIALVVTLLGSASAQDFQKGVDAYRRGDYAAAFRELRPLADQGHAVAQFNLGVMCDKGQGVPQDYAEAVRWHRKAAEQGFAHAQFNLGVMYDKGQGVPQDYAEAARWFRKAAEQGDAEAQYGLGMMYHKGQGVPEDKVSAYMWFNLSAAQGDKDANTNKTNAAKRMTNEQIAEAQRLSRECFARNYNGC